jgi:cation diffusion facilitator family transporter
MRVGRPFELPPEIRRDYARARQIAWLSIGLLAIGTVALILTVGQSEAMKTAWVTDALSILPPIGFLVALRYEFRPPTRRFPFGYFRALSIAYFVTAAVLTLIGCWLLIDALVKLLRGERPPIGSLVIAGHQLWAGWAMLAALTLSMGIGVVLGRLKLPVAKRLHDKALYSDAQMNRDEWHSEAAAVIGIVLVGFGRWWGDAAAAAVISLDIIRDGWLNVRQVVADLMDESPTVIGHHRKLDDLPARLERAAGQLDWVDRAAVRLREQGRVLSGQVFVVPRAGTTDLVRRTEAAAAELTRLDWRLYELLVVPVSAIHDTAPPRL